MTTRTDRQPGDPRTVIGLMYRIIDQPRRAACTTRSSSCHSVSRPRRSGAVQCSACRLRGSAVRAASRAPRCWPGFAVELASVRNSLPLTTSSEITLVRAVRSSSSGTPVGPKGATPLQRRARLPNALSTAGQTETQRSPPRPLTNAQMILVMEKPLVDVLFPRSVSRSLGLITGAFNP